MHESCLVCDLGPQSWAPCMGRWWSGSSVPVSPLCSASELMPTSKTCILLGKIRPYCGWQEGSSFHTLGNGIRQRGRKRLHVRASLPTSLKVGSGRPARGHEYKLPFPVTRGEIAPRLKWGLLSQTTLSSIYQLRDLGQVT